MSDDELVSGMASLGDNHPFLRSLDELLERGIADEQGAVAQPASTDAARHFNAGRLARALDFRELINDYRRRSAESLTDKAQ